MKFTRTKYLIVFFLLTTFLLRGAETVLPFFTGYFAEQSRHEMQANNAEKNSPEKPEEKLTEKEFFSHFLHDYTSNLNNILTSIHVPERSSAFERETYLPVYTPPPEFIG